MVLVRSCCSQGLDWLLNLPQTRHPLLQDGPLYCPERRAQLPPFRKEASETNAANWLVRVDAIVFSSAVLHESFPFTYHLPGWVATLALVLMNLVSREQLSEAGDTYGGDDNSAVRS